MSTAQNNYPVPTDAALEVAERRSDQGVTTFAGGIGCWGEVHPPIFTESVLTTHELTGKPRRVTGSARADTHDDPRAETEGQPSRELSPSRAQSAEWQNFLAAKQEQYQAVLNDPDASVRKKAQARTYLEQNGTGTKPSKSRVTNTSVVLSRIHPALVGTGVNDMVQ